MKISILEGNPTLQIEDRVNYIITVADSIGDASSLLADIVEAEGDLIVGLAAGSAARLAIGTNQYYLRVNTGVAGKIEWVDFGKSVEFFPRSSGDVAVSGLQAAAYSVVQSSGAGTIKPQFPVLAFDKDTDEGRIWSFHLPSSYIGTPVLRGKFYTTVTTGNVQFGAHIAGQSDADAGATAKVFDAVNLSAVIAVPGTAGTIKEFTISLANADSIAANDFCQIAFFRDISGGAAAADIILTELVLEFA